MDTIKRLAIYPAVLLMLGGGTAWTLSQAPRIATQQIKQLRLDAPTKKGQVSIWATRPAKSKVRIWATSPTKQHKQLK